MEKAKSQTLSFIGEDVFQKQSSVPKEEKNLFKIFDWDKAAEIIKSKLLEHPNLTAEAGLSGDWDYTGGVIFQDGLTQENYTFLSSNWATPTLIINIDGNEEEIPCYTTDKETRFDSNSKWDAQSLEILNSK